MNEPELKVVSYSERALIAGLIMSDEFISGIEPIFNPRYLDTKYTQIVAGWCLDYFKKYGKAPDNHIYDLFDKKRSNGLNPNQAQLIDVLLSGMAEQYGEESFNPQLILDEARNAFQRKGYDLLADDIKERLDAGDVAGAKKLQTEFKPFHPEIKEENSLQKALADNSLVMSFEDLEASDLPQAERLIDGAIPIETETITLITGEPGIGKTFLTLEILKVAASGETGLAGCITSSGGCKCLYVDGELPENELKRMSQLLGLSVYRGLDIISKSKVERLDLKPGLNLLESETRGWLGEFILTNNYKLVALDNIFSLFGGIDHDSAKEWSPINDFLVRLRSKGVAVILLHHPGKSGDQLGTSSRLFNLNTALVLRKSVPDDKITENTACFNITIQKQRGIGLRLSGKKFVFRDGAWSVEGDKQYDEELKLAMVAVGLVDNRVRSELASEIGFKNRSSINQKETELRERKLITGSKGNIIFTDSGREFVNDLTGKIYG